MFALKSNLEKERLAAPIAAEEKEFDDDSLSSNEFTAQSMYGDSFSVLCELFEAQQLCDIHLRIGKKSIKCHRIILASASPYFRAMLTLEMSESKQDVITIRDIDELAMHALVKFMYTSKIKLTTENVQPLLYASSILQMETVARACCEFMKNHLHPSNVLGVRNFAELHGRSALVKAADKYTYDNFIEVTECDEYLHISARHLGLLLTSSDLKVTNEEEVYNASIKWVSYIPEKRQKHLPDLMSKIRLPMLSPEFLMNVVEKEDMIKKNHTCRDYVDEAKNYHLSVASVHPKTTPQHRFSLRSKPRKSTAVPSRRKKKHIATLGENMTLRDLAALNLTQAENTLLMEGKRTRSGVLFTVGGRGNLGDPFRSIECYDLREDKWFHITEMSSRRRHVGCTSVNGKVYAVGGHDGREHLNTMEMFDPVKNIWTILSPMKTYRRGCAVTHLNGPIYAIGGLDEGGCYSDVERYDVTSDEWDFVAPMNCPRGGVGVVPLLNCIFAIGGNDGATSLNTCEKYDPHINKWIEVAKMTTRRAGAGMATMNGLIYAVGGFDDNSPLDTVECYDPQSNTWSSVPRMASARGGVGVTALGGKIYAVGGHDGSSYLNSVECFDPVSSRWETVSPISICRAGAGVVTCECSVSELKMMGQGINVVSCV